MTVRRFKNVYQLPLSSGKPIIHVKKVIKGPKWFVTTMLETKIKI